MKSKLVTKRRFFATEKVQTPAQGMKRPRTGLTEPGHGFQQAGCNLIQQSEIPESLGMSSWRPANQS